MYDSITSHLIRLARRSWLVIVLALLVGAALGALMANRQRSWTGTATIQVADVSTTVSLLGLGGEEQSLAPDTGIRSITIRSVEDFESTAGDTTVSATPDELANIIVAVAVGPDSSAVDSALIDFETIVERRATDPRIAEADAALAANETALETFQAQLDAVDQELASLAADDPARAALAEGRTNLQSDIRELQVTTESLLQYRAFLETELVSTIGLTITGPGSAVTSVIVGIIAMAILLTVVGAVVVVIDQRVRRRLQLERLLPGVPLLAVLPTPIGAGSDAREAAQSIDRFVEAEHADAVSLVGLDGADVAATVAALQPLTDAALVEHVSEGAAATAPYLVVIEWGRTTENEVAARLAALESASGRSVAMLMTGVPERDLDWAGATGRGADVDPAR